MTSVPHANFVNSFLVDKKKKIYTIDNFTIKNDGEVLDGETWTELLFGTDRNDIIWGNGGADTLYGNGGRDLITGGAGDDLIFGGKGDDRLQGWDQDDLLYGGAGKDALYGGAGNDRLYGGKGDDYLCAGSGFDRLHGGAGKDVFVFRPELDAPKSESVYLDFQVGKDELRIENSLLPSGLTKAMIKVDGDGNLCIKTEGGHRMTFMTLDASDIEALHDSIFLIG